MRRIFTLSLVLLLLLAGSVQAQKVIVEFRGMKFGGDITGMEHMSTPENRGALSLYHKYGDDKTFQGVPLAELKYGFYKNKFCLVMFSARGLEAFNTFKAFFDANYGPAKQNKDLRQYTYVAGDVNIECAYDDTRKVAEISYAYQPAMRELMPPKGDK